MANYIALEIQPGEEARLVKSEVAPVPSPPRARALSMVGESVAM
jgi:hypothetical protein